MQRKNQRPCTCPKDHSGQGNDLFIPERFTPLRRRMLAMSQEDFRPNLRYTRDVGINILGFLPFGFYVAWYFSEKSINRLTVVFIVLVLGAGTSLFIEVIQAYLPERSSQLTDIIMNTGGTAIGVYLWRRYISPVHQFSFFI